ncbi:MAG: LysR family transcriptional regulator [Janthinobacterium lividum]
MIDTLNLDHLRVFIAIADHGSFSAAGRRLRRAQSAISNAVANLEEALGVVLFDRSGWKPQLTPQAHALLLDARAVTSRADQLKARAWGMTRGLEAELSVVIDVMFPTVQWVEVIASFQETFPGVVLRLCTDVLGGVPERVTAGEYDIGIQGSLPDIPSGLAGHLLTEIESTPVAAPKYSLAGQRGMSGAILADHTQIVLTDRSTLTSGRTFSVFGARQILTTDPGSKHAMLRAGLGWGFMPHRVAEKDLRAGRLVESDIGKRPPRSRSLPPFLIHRRGDAPGPAGQWLLHAFKRQFDASSM